MKKTLTEEITSGIKIIAIALALSIGISYLFAWTGPTDSPPGGNVSAPINVGSSAQAKAGGLSLGTNSVPTLPSLFRINCPAGDCAGKVLMSDMFGNARWEMPAPGFVLLDTPIVLANPGGEPAFYTYDGTWPKVINFSGSSGTIQAGVTGVLPSGAKGVLLYGMIDTNNGLAKYIRYKHPNHTNWKRLVFINDASYGSDNSVWVPLDSSGRLNWEISSDTEATGFRLEIQGYY